jgi:transposase
MRPQSPFPVGTTERMEKLLESTHSLGEYRRIQSIYFRSKYGFSAVQIAKMVGLKLPTVHNIHSTYLREGEAALRLTGKGGRRRFTLSLEEEGALLGVFEMDGRLGKILEVSQVHHAYEEQVGQQVPKCTVYRLLHRHGWRKLAPRPKHPKGNKEAVKHLKKTSLGL